MTLVEGALLFIPKLSLTRKQLNNRGAIKIATDVLIKTITYLVDVNS
jgi:hypothetical protein